MSRRVRFAPEAAAELTDAARWYDQRREGLGLAFLVAVDLAIGTIVRWPHAGALVPGLHEGIEVRRVPVARYPYGVAYLVTDDDVHVLAIAHHRRRLASWRAGPPSDGRGPSASPSARDAPMGLLESWRRAERAFSAIRSASLRRAHRDERREPVARRAGRGVLGRRQPFLSTVASGRAARSGGRRPPAVSSSGGQGLIRAGARAPEPRSSAPHAPHPRPYLDCLSYGRYDCCMTGRDFRLLAFFPCDHASAENGKVYVNGGFWSRLNFPAYPQVVPAIALVAVVEVPFARYHAEHEFAIGMIDPDGNALPLDIRGKFRVGAGPDMEYGDPTVMPITVPIHNLVLERAGDYSFSFAVDGAELGRYSVRAVQVPVALQFNLSPPPRPPQSEAG